MKSFLIISLVRNESGIGFNADRESSTVSSHNYCDIFLSGKCILKNDSQKQLCHTFLKFFINWEQTQIQKNKYPAFLESQDIYEQFLLSKDKYQYIYHICLESFSTQEQTLIHEGSYQLLYYTFPDFCNSQEQTLMFHHILE